ncbi:16S rRNA (guanine(966)-N(2))-methyltransferase RsmD [Pseudonocardia nigra]|uniref:16S rRNA (guanine(966)-N(2))-methyltransferase RsmD n=1 Tax=Pseudonocardia nigra TaxID=1921578 RepID=UPI001C5FF704|nr:16S rRNA (guanine(966)-N(2))-methyltransferase RsmD [Pseudonocardia nigra]
MTRIIAGAAGGRRLAVPPRGTRPTSDRVREALFSALDNAPGLAGAAVLDLCAGSGALGLEALSRGAGHALFVESDRRAAAVLRRNVADLGLPGAVVRLGAAGSVLAGPADRTYDVVLVDPPYDVPDAEVAGWLAAAAAHGWLAEDVVVVVERARGAAFPWPPPLRSLRERRYGDTVLHVGHQPQHGCYRPRP